MGDALVIDAIDSFYGDSHVLHGISFTLGAGRLLGLLGRNGAGKTTMMHTITGLLSPRHGRILLHGQSIAGKPPEAIARLGVALVPQGRRIFRSLSVRENLLVAARKPDAGLAPWTLERVFSAFPRLAERQRHSAANLSGGEQQMLAIGRALMMNPEILLLDEPSEGLAPQIVAELMALIASLKAEGLSIILVEQNAGLVRDIADDIVILNSGHLAIAATPAEIDHQGIDLHQHLGLF